MTCGLSEGALFILNLLYQGRCLAKNEGYNSKKLSKIYSRRFSSDFKHTIKDFKHTIKELLGDYITQIRKNDIKYYISNFKLMSFALTSHGYLVTKGRERPL